MKKLLAALVIALFIGGITAPVMASSSNAFVSISISKDDPKKKEKKETKKSDATAKKGEGCGSAESTPCSKDCTGKEKK